VHNCPDLVFRISIGHRLGQRVGERSDSPDKVLDLLDSRHEDGCWGRAGDKK